MPNKITILTPELINQIAAGEIVERPASVVKELVENSIDADAKNIAIEIENGGLNLIKIIDDGCGMSLNDAKLCVLQHATSKIKALEDLYNIQTLGFRGEALASIAAVSRFSLITKDADSLAGTKIDVLGGVVEVGDIGAKQGTVISARELFYNVPARQKYLKSVVTEFNHIVDLFFNYCLAFPAISWKLNHNGKTIYHFPIADWFDRIGDVLGDEISSNLMPVNVKLNDIDVSGFIGKPQISRNNKKLQYIFINSRPVNEFIIAKQIKDAYGTLLMKDEFPVFILDLQVNNEDVDVNVHPRKMEVRFSEPFLVYKTIYQIIGRALDENDLIVQADLPPRKEFIPIKDIIQSDQKPIPINYGSSSAGGNNYQEKIFMSGSGLNQPRVDLNVFNETLLNQQPAPPLDIQSFVQVEDSPKADEYQILGQIDNSYIIVSCGSGLKIYDQHASSERIQYEKIKRQWDIGKLSSQKMLIPENIELTAQEARIMEENQEFFDRLGFEVSALSGNCLLISSVPQFLQGENLKKVMLEIIAELTDTVMLDTSLSQPIGRIFKMMACKSAVKFGDSLNREEMSALINGLNALENRYTCAHGRPCVIEFNWDELKKMFKR